MDDVPRVNKSKPSPLFVPRDNLAATDRPPPSALRFATSFVCKMNPQEISNQATLLRTNPSSFIPDLQAMLPLFQGNNLHRPEGILMTKEGASVVQETIAFLSNQHPVGPLVFDPIVSQAAERHGKDLGPKGLTAHEGSDGSTPKSRIEDVCDWKVTMGENLDFGSKTPRQVILSLCIDDGVPGRGHRTNLFNPQFTNVGIWSGPHTQYGVCTVMDFTGGTAPKSNKLSTALTLTDQTTVTLEVKSILDSIPFDNIKQLVPQAMANGSKVDLIYKPGSIEVKIKQGNGWSTQSGTWTV